MAAAVARLAMLDGPRDQSERTRRHFDVFAQKLRDDINWIAENQVGCRTA